MIKYVGIDNGVTSEGIGFVTDTGHSALFRTPIRPDKSGCPGVGGNRINFEKLLAIFEEIKQYGDPSAEIIVLLEPPMLGGGFKGGHAGAATTASAARCLEATILALELSGLFGKHVFIRAQEWQRVLLPGVQGRDALKAASLARGLELYPDLPLKHDADGVLLAHFGKATGLTSAPPVVATKPKKRKKKSNVKTDAGAAKPTKNTKGLSTPPDSSLHDDGRPNEGEKPKRTRTRSTK